MAHDIKVVGDRRLRLKSIGFSGFDSASISFFTRAGITNTTQKNAVNKLVLDLKAAGIWSKMSAIYPLVGGTAGSHSHNLISSSFQITWAGGITHNANGITGNGTTGFGDTGLKPSDLGLNGGVSSYIRGLPAGDNNKSMGVDNGVDRIYDIVLDITTGQSYGRYGANLSAVRAGAPLVGMYSIHRLSPTSLRFDYNGASAGTNINNSSVSVLALNFFILCGNSNGATVFFSEENNALYAFHQGLSTTESALQYSAIQRFQTTLGRQV